MSLYELYQRVIGALRDTGKDISKIPAWKQAGFIQEHRNAAQHDAVAPDVSVIEHARVYANDFLTEVFPLAFDTQFSEVSLAFLVDDECSKKLIIRAEGELSNGHLIESACFATAAFLLAKERITRHERRRWSWTFSSKVARSIGAISDNSSLQRDVEAFLEWVERSIDDLKLGFIDEDYYYYAEIAPKFGCIITLAKTVRFHYGRKPDRIPTESDCHWMIEYVTSTVSRWEKQFGFREVLLDDETIEAIPNIAQWVQRDIEESG